MKIPRPLIVVCVLAGLAATPFRAGATDTYDYKPGETLVIDHGLAPDKQFAIAAGDSIKNGESVFHLFLFDAKARKRIGPLEETVEALDTGAGSIHAAWAPDSRHVAITYRIDRHETQMYLYRVENRRAFLVTGPDDLFDAVKGSKAFETTLRKGIYQLPKWESATRFRLHQESYFRQVTRDPAPVLGAYVQVDASEGENAQTPDGKKTYAFDFYADGVCELTGGDKFRVISVKPGKPNS